MRLIDADALKKALDELFENGGYDSGLVMNLIDNAPTVDTYTEDDVHYAIKEGHQVGYEMAKAKFERPHGEIIKELWNCRDELCLKCERYKEAWNGACKDCRYNFENMEKWKGGLR